jgi:hypothetical protein
MFTRQLIPRESTQQQITFQRPTLYGLIHQSRSQRILRLVWARERSDIVGRCGACDRRYVPVSVEVAMGRRGDSGWWIAKHVDGRHCLSVFERTVVAFLFEERNCWWKSWRRLRAGMMISQSLLPKYFLPLKFPCKFYTFALLMMSWRGSLFSCNVVSLNLLPIIKILSLLYGPVTFRRT